LPATGCGAKSLKRTSGAEQRDALCDHSGRGVGGSAEHSWPAALAAAEDAHLDAARW